MGPMVVIPAEKIINPAHKTATITGQNPLGVAISVSTIFVINIKTGDAVLPLDDFWLVCTLTALTMVYFTPT